MRATAAAAAAIAAVAVVPATAAARTGRCDAQRAFLRSPQVVVFKRAGAQDDGTGNPVTRYLACARPDGKPRLLARDTDGGGEYSGNYILLRARVAGRYAAAWEEDGAGDSELCGKAQGSPCPTPSYQVTVVDPRSRRVAHLTTDAPPLGRAHPALFLSGAGAAAWVSGSGLYATRLVASGPRGLAGNPQQIDTGNVSAVRLSGFTLSWTKDGQSHTATLR